MAARTPFTQGLQARLGLGVAREVARAVGRPMLHAPRSTRIPLHRRLIAAGAAINVQFLSEHRDFDARWAAASPRTLRAIARAMNDVQVLGETSPARFILLPRWPRGRRVPSDLYYSYLPPVAGDPTIATCAARRLWLDGVDEYMTLHLASGPVPWFCCTWLPRDVDVLSKTLIFHAAEPCRPAAAARAAIATVASHVAVRGVRVLAAVSDVPIDAEGHATAAVPAAWGGVDARRVTLKRWHSPVAQRRVRCCALMNTPASPRAFPRHAVQWQWDAARAPHTQRTRVKVFMVLALSRGVTVVSPCYPELRMTAAAAATLLLPLAI